MKRRILSMIFALALVCPMLFVRVGAAELPEGLEEAIQEWLEQNWSNGGTDSPWSGGYQWGYEIPEIYTYSGSCGTNVQWNFESETAVLRISGTGAMDDGRVPWSSISERIERVVIESGVTHIGEWAFCLCENLTQITIPDTVTSIGSFAFQGDCQNLRDIYYGGHRNQWDALRKKDAFVNPHKISIHCNIGAFSTDGQPGFANFQRTRIYSGAFSDVDPGAWYYKNMVSVYEMGLMNGTDDTHFSPAGNLSIAQTLALACRLRSIYLDDGYKFETLSPWYQTYVDYAVDQGLMTATQFPNYGAVATRMDFAGILGILPQELLAEINQIQDRSIPNVSLDDRYKDEVYALYRAGIIVGSDKKGTFAASSPIRRSEAAVIVARITDPSLRSKAALSTEFVTLYGDSGATIQSPVWETGRYQAMGWQKAPFTVSPSSGAKSILNAASLTPMRTNYQLLDDLVDSIFSRIFTPGMKTYDKLKACYDYIIDHTVYGLEGYLTSASPEVVSVIDSLGNPYSQDIGDDRYVNMAYTALTTGHGLCDHYAAALMVMARRIGLEAYCYTGETSMAGGGYTSHTWTVITIGGVDYVFDAQVEDNIAKGGKIQYYRFCKTFEQVAANYKDYEDVDYKARFGGFKYRET